MGYSLPLTIINERAIGLDEWAHIVVTYDKVTLSIYQNKNKVFGEALSHQILEFGANLLIGLESDDR